MNNLSLKRNLIIVIFICATLIISCQSDKKSKDPVAPFILTEITDGRIFQRDENNQYDMTVNGTYSGSPSAIQARVINNSDSSEEIIWTTIDDSPGGGTFSGILDNVPQGGWYELQVRFSDDTSISCNPEGKFAVGVLIACTGQSHIDYWFDTDWGAGAPEANELARMYRHEQVLQAGDEWTGWQTVTGMGATIFANTLIEALGIPVGLLDYGVQGASLWQGNMLMDLFGWWLGDDSGLAPAANNYAVFKAGLDSIDNKIEALLWVQGHTDAMQAESTADYKTGLDDLFTLMRSETGVSDLPIFISLVTRQSSTPDDNIQAIRDAEVMKCIENVNTYLASTTMDIPLSTDNIHYTPDGQNIHALRMAQSVLHVILNSGDYTYYRGPQITGYEIVDWDTVDIQISHSGGTDFTPETDILGFNIQGTEIVSAVRWDSDTIRLDISDDTSSITSITYLYGGNPDGQNLQSYVTGYVHDNSPLQLPLEGNANIPEL